MDGLVDMHTGQLFPTVPQTFAKCGQLKQLRKRTTMLHSTNRFFIASGLEGI
jgi:hypothetical protein